MSKETFTKIDEIMAKYNQETDRCKAEQSRIEEEFNGKCQKLLRKYKIS